ncbi:MAG: GTPase Era [Candidatus Caldatribacteriaceae bacterium]
MSLKSGFVGIWGRPNVGKSTFLNQILGQKIAIVSSKPQTTRRRIKGILHREDAQIVFVDTPGLHVPQDELGKFMVQETRDSLVDLDLLCYLVDPFVKVQEEVPYLSLLRSFPKPVFLILNKKDLGASEEKVREIFQHLEQVFPFREKLAVSSLTGEGIGEVIEKVIAYLPEGPTYYEEGIVSDVFERDIVAEIVREKVWWYVFEEVPYGVEVRVEEFREKEKVLYIRALIYVERESHKKIIIGEGGKTLKKIGQNAREEIEAQWGRKVFLDLWVKVEKNWRKREDVLRRWGYRVR